ncbi:MAG: alkaline phosphatase D family protein [Planctomycetes bacterium]|nr:alkaline phosphatase D family protein [Planctomycetota bacterium]
MKTLHALTVAAFCGALSTTFGQTETHGTLVGEVSPAGARIWAHAPIATRVKLAYATNSALAAALETASANVTSATGFSVQFALTGLSADTRYYYAFRFEDPANPGVFHQGTIGTFRTAPLPGSSVPVRFGFGGDLRNPSEYGIFAALRTQNLDFFVNLGDFPYTDASPAAVTAPEYRQKHLVARDESTFQSFTRLVPFLAIWDDHEVVNNWDGATDPVRVATGTSVWREVFPIRPGNDIYRTLRWGRELEIFFLDCRRYRSTNSDPDLPGVKRMLGVPQMTWLKQALSASTATVKVVASSVPLRYSTGLDHWNGFMHARRELFEYVEQQGIPGVLFISADQHRPANNHHREGFKEFVAGPLAIAPSGTPLRIDPEMRWSRAERTYSILSIDPNVTPLRVEVQHWSATGLLWREEVDVQEPARVRVTSDEPEGAFRLVGPQYLRGSGADTTFARVEPGHYALCVDADVRVEDRPAEMEFDVRPGQEVEVALQRADTPSSNHPVLFATSFEGPLTGAAIVTQGTTSGPASWFTDNGLLHQSSNVHTPGVDPGFPGSMAIFGNTTWQDYTLSCRMRSEDNDGFGLVFRVANGQNYYRFQWDAERNLRRLTRTSTGVTTVLDEDTVPYDTLRWYQVEVTCIGAQLTVRVDGHVVLSGVDATLPRGAVGCWVWANALTAFDDLIVRQGDATGGSASTWLRDHFEDGTLSGFSILDEGTTSAPSVWVERAGELVQESNIYSGSGVATNLVRAGTMALAGSPAWSDYLFHVRLMNEDNDGIGVVFRYAWANDYERFSMDAQGGFRQYSRKVGGTWTDVHTDFVTYTPGRIYDIEILTRGDERRIRIDGETFYEGSSGGGSSVGRVGLYAFASTNAHFDDLVVRPIPEERPILAAFREATGYRFQGRAPRSAGDILFLALSLGRNPGLPASVIDPQDPRVLHLVPDGLFLTSLTPSPWLMGFQQVLSSDGAFTASLVLPSLPALSGVPFHAAGFTVPASGRSLTELLPTVDLRFP